MLIFSSAVLFTIFKYLNTMVCLENTDPATREESKDFFADTLNPSFIDFTYIYIIENLISLSLDFVHVKPF